MFIKEIRSFIKRTILLLLLVVTLVIFTNTLIQSPYIQSEILKRISNAIGYDIEAKDIEINLWKGVAISINDLSAGSRRGDKRFSASNLRLTLDCRQLLAGRIMPSSFYLTEPVIELPWEEEYSPSPDLKRFLPEKIPFFWFSGIHSLVIEQGEVIFTGASFNLESFDLRAVGVGFSPSLEFMTISSGQIVFKKEKAGFKINGRITPPSNESGPLLIDLKFNTDKAPLSWFKWPESLPVKDGYIKTRLDIEGDPTTHLAMKGMIDLTNFRFEIIRIKKDRHKEFFIPELALDFQSIINHDNIDMSALKIKGDDLSVDLDFTLDLNNGGHPFLDLNFKSEFMGAETFKSLFPSSLLPLWLETRLFPILTAGDIRVNNFNLKGGVDQIRHMKMPGNQSVMEMLFECRSFEASGGGIQSPFKNISAEVALKDGLFSVSGLTAVFGDSLIKNAGLNIRDVFSSSRFYEINIEGDFGIRELISQKSMEVVPLNVSGYLDQWPDITGRMICKTSIGYQKGWDYPRVLEGDFLLKGFFMDKKEFKFPVIFEDARIHIDDTDSNYILGSGLWGNNSFNISGNFGIAGITPYFKDGLVSADMDMSEIFSVFNLTEKIPLIFSETLPCDLSLAKEEDVWSVKGRIDIKDTVARVGGFMIKSSGRNKDNIVFELGIKPCEKRIDINKAVLRLRGSLINTTGMYDLQVRRFINVDLDSSALVLKDISVVADKKEVFSSGVLKGDLNISMADGGGAGPSITGIMEGMGLSFQAGVNSPIVRDCSFKMDFSGKDARLDYCNMTAGKSDFSLTGDIKGWKDIKGEMKVYSDYLDLMDIITKQETSSHERVVDRLNLLMHVDVSKWQWRKFAFGSAKAELAYENGNLFIKDSQVHLDNGDLTLKGHILKVPAPERFFTGDFHIKNQPVDELIEGIGIAYTGLKGNIAAEGSLSVKGKEEKSLLSGLNGSMNVSITKGLIKNPNVFIKVLDFLSLQKIFKQRPPDLKEKGLYFERISGDAVIENGVLRSDNFVMRSPVMNSVAMGEASIPERKVDFILGVQPHGLIDSFVSKVPILGYIIAGENKSIVAYPFEVKGDMSDPDVKFVPFDTLEGGVPGILKRIFLTPARMINKLEKALNNNSEKSEP